MFGLRLGFFAGFLIGAIASSLLAPETGDGSDDPNTAAGQARSLVRDVRAAAREAADQKEREMRRDYYIATHPTL